MIEYFRILVLLQCSTKLSRPKLISADKADKSQTLPRPSPSYTYIFQSSPTACYMYTTLWTPMIGSDNMAEIFTQTVLRCEQCNKPFNTTKQLKRHGYYCQFRRRGPVSRARACLHCATSKVVCDKVLPSCARCIIKSISCEYPAKSTMKDARTSRNHDSPTVSTDSHVSILVKPTHTVNSGIRVEDAAEVVLPQGFNATFDGLDPTDLDWRTPTFEFADLWTAPAAEKELYPSAAFVVPQSEVVSTILSDQEQAAMSFDLPIPATVKDSRSLVPRPSATANHQRTVSLIFSTFKSYLLMLQQNTMQPFIHPSILQSALSDNQLEPLTTCINLVQMLGKSLRGSRQLFWRNVRMECECWNADVSYAFS